MPSTAWLLAEFAYAKRQLLRSRWFSAGVICTLALGIGLTSGLFSALDAAILKPLPYVAPAGITRIELRDARFGFVANPSSAITARMAGPSGPIHQWATARRALSHVLGLGGPEQMLTASVSSSFFSIFGVEPLMGRSFSARDQPQTVAVLSYSFWKTHFAGGQRALGQTLEVDGATLVIVGVMPARFDYPVDVRIWVEDANDAIDHAVSLAPYETIARLSAGTSVHQAQADADILQNRLRIEAPELEGYTLRVVNLGESLAASYTSFLWLLLGAAVFVLLVACANAANLLLSRAPRRRHELAVRAGLGASRTQLITELLLEGLMLALAAALVGLVVAWWAVHLFRSLAPERFPHLAQMALDRRVFGFALFLSFCSALAFSLWPALRMAAPDIQRGLNVGGGTFTSADRRHVFSSQALLFVQVALSTLLLIGAALELASFSRLGRVDTGIALDHVIAVRLTPLEEYRSAERRLQFYRQAIARVREVTGVQSAAGVNVVPLNNVQALARKAVAGDLSPRSILGGVRLNIISPDYFRTLRVPFISGREFQESDGDDVVVVNKALADRLWPGGDAVGHRVGLASSTGQIGHLDKTVIGIAANSRELLKRTPEPELYLPLSELPSSALFLVIRTKSDPRLLVSQLKQAVWSVDPAQPLSNIHTMEDMRSAQMATERLITILTSIFGATALLLAMIGLVSFLAHWASQRRFELAIRAAVGADAAALTRLSVGQIIPALAFGAAAGLLLARGLAGVLAHTLFEIRPTDPTLYIAIALLQLLVGFVAALVPARRAGHLNPASILRRE